MGWPPDPTHQRFWSKVAIAGPDECWLWTASDDGRGRYGKARVDGVRDGAHRHAWRLTYGEIPADLTVDHICFAYACCNPTHLQLLTWDAQRRRQRSALWTHCSRGHEFTAENTYLTARGGRQCRACVNLTSREARRTTAISRGVIFNDEGRNAYCKNGHLLSDDNVRQDKRQRRCRTCERINLQASRARRRAQQLEAAQ